MSAEGVSNPGLPHLLPLPRERTQASVNTILEGHMVLAALLRSELLVLEESGRNPRPGPPERLVGLARAIVGRVEDTAGQQPASCALAEDDLMVLCHGLEVLGALSPEYHEGEPGVSSVDGRETALWTGSGAVLPLLL